MSKHTVNLTRNRKSIAEKMKHILPVEAFLAEQRYSFFSSAHLPLLEAAPTSLFPVIGEDIQEMSFEPIGRAIAKAERILAEMPPDERKEALIRGGSGCGKAFSAKKSISTS